MKIKPVMSLPKNMKLICGDFRTEADQIKDNSIDLVFCDPMYDQKSIGLYADIANVAKRVLKNGCSLILYAGQYFLPEIIKSIESSGSGLNYHWAFCLKLNHGHKLIYNKNVFASWKPLLLYVKGDKPKFSSDNISDIITSPEKALYRYQQSVEEASYIIKHLTVKNALIADFCCGSCTTGIAALANNRKFIGCEIDKEVFKVAKKRITQYLNRNRNHN